MRKSLLASVAVVGLTTASFAYAQENATTTDPAMGAGNAVEEMQQGVENTADQAGDMAEGAAQEVEQGIEGAGPEMTETDDGSMGTAPSMTNADAQRYQSYSGTEPGSFAGTIAGNYSADDLMDANIVDAEGNSVGEVSDLLIGDDGSIQNVLVDVGGFLGIGQRTVALDLNQIQMAQGDADELVVSMSKEQVEALPEIEETDGGWATRTEAVPAAPMDGMPAATDDAMPATTNQ